MNKKLKTWLSNIVLVTGIITAITGALESIGKMITFFKGMDVAPIPKALPEINKSFPEIYKLYPEVITQVSPWTEYRGLILIMTGIIMIIVHSLIYRNGK